MSTAPTSIEDEAEWPQFVNLRVAGEMCMGTLAGGTGITVAALNDGRSAVLLAMRYDDCSRALFQPIGTRTIGEALIASLRASMDEAGL